jgi:hypothetical protein
MFDEESVVSQWDRPVKNDKMDCWRLKVVFMGSGVAGIVDGCCAGLDAWVSGGVGGGALGRVRGVALASTGEVLRLVRVYGLVDIRPFSEGDGRGGT